MRRCACHDAGTPPLLSLLLSPSLLRVLRSRGPEFEVFARSPLSGVSERAHTRERCHCRLHTRMHSARIARRAAQTHGAMRRTHHRSLQSSGRRASLMPPSALTTASCAGSPHSKPQLAAANHCTTCSSCCCTLLAELLITPSGTGAPRAMPLAEHSVSEASLASCCLERPPHWVLSVCLHVRGTQAEIEALSFNPRRLSYLTRGGGRI